VEPGALTPEVAWAVREVQRRQSFPVEAALGSLKSPFRPTAPLRKWVVAVMDAYVALHGEPVNPKPPDLSRGGEEDEEVDMRGDPDEVRSRRLAKKAKEAVAQLTVAEQTEKFSERELVDLLDRLSTSVTQAGHPPLGQHPSLCHRRPLPGRSRGRAGGRHAGRGVGDADDVGRRAWRHAVRT
jgi:hypothetical protein